MAATRNQRACNKHFRQLKENTEKLILNPEIEPNDPYIEFFAALCKAIEESSGDESYKVQAWVNGRLILQQFDFVVKK